MNFMKTYNSTKTFYGTYLYKLQVRTSLSFLFYGSTQTKKPDYSVYNSHVDELGSKNELKINRWRTATRQQFVDARIILDCIINSDVEFKLRCESYSLSIYTNDCEFLEKIAEDLSFDARAKLWKPEKSAEDFLTNNKNVIVSSKPVDYPYKVYLKSDYTQKGYDALVKWLKSNTDKSKVGHNTLYNLEHGCYITGNYFYVKDLKVLMIVEMVAGKVISKIDNVVYIGDIDK